MLTPAHFPRNYGAARRRFLNAAGHVGGAVRKVEMPLLGPEGDELGTDLVLLGDPGASKLLIILSGTHGVEGIAGSGCQSTWVEEGHANRLPADTAVLLVHAVNPFGMAWCRRVNEDNIDLNRNFVDYPQLDFANPNYEALGEILVPEALDGAGRERSDARLAAARRELGEHAFMVAVLGQYSHADGLYFGGHGPSWSRQMVEGIIQDECRSRELVVTLDLHTGLGHYGYGLIGVANDRSSQEMALARRWFGPPMVSFEEVGAQYPGFPDYSRLVSGMLMRFFVDALPETQVVAAGVEFGTYPYDLVLQAELSDLWLHHNPDTPPEFAERVRRELLEVYAPAESSWAEMVWHRARQVIRLALEGMDSFDGARN